MTLKEQVNEDLKAAMKAKDQASVRSIRAIKAAILLAETDGSGSEIDEEREIKIVQKLIKQRQDSLAIYEEQGRDDLALTEREEINVLSRYLPEQLSQDELKSIVTQIIEESGASSMKDMGKVMGMASKRVAGRADNKELANMVKAMLQG